MRILALCLLLAGLLIACDNWMSMDCPKVGEQINTASILWVRSSDPKVACQALGVETLDRGGACIQCTQVAAGAMSCIMHAEDPGAVSDTVLGHEAKHAFGCKHGRYF